MVLPTPLLGVRTKTGNIDSNSSQRSLDRNIEGPAVGATETDVCWSIPTVVRGEDGTQVFTRRRDHCDTTAASTACAVKVPVHIHLLREFAKTTPHASVVMMTAVADSEIAREARRLGAFDYILKPCAFSGIEACISAAISDFEYRYGIG